MLGAGTRIESVLGLVCVCVGSWQEISRQKMQFAVLGAHGCLYPALGPSPMLAECLRNKKDKCSGIITV